MNGGDLIGNFMVVGKTRIRADVHNNSFIVGMNSCYSCYSQPNLTRPCWRHFPLRRSYDEQQTHIWIWDIMDFSQSNLASVWDTVKNRIAFVLPIDVGQISSSNTTRWDRLIIDATSFWIGECCSIRWEVVIINLILEFVAAQGWIYSTY